MCIAVGDRMFLGMQDFDFCPNVIKFYPIDPNLIKFCPNLPKNISLGDAAATTNLRNWPDDYVSTVHE